MKRRSSTLGRRLHAVTFLLLDVDGVLTDGRLTFTSDGRELKTFHTHDGHGIKVLLNAGVGVGILSGRRSPIVLRRARELGIREVHQGVRDKLVHYERILSRRGLTDSQVAFIGDDIPDVPVLRRVGFAVAVRNAHPAAKACADYVTLLSGGDGAVREVSDLLLQSKRGS